MTKCVVLSFCADTQVLSGSAGSTVYAPITAVVGAQGASVIGGTVLGKAGSTGYLHFSYTPKGDAFVVNAAVDPMPCFCKWN
jgi:hypothetical protein